MFCIYGIWFTSCSLLVAFTAFLACLLPALQAEISDGFHGRGRGGLIVSGMSFVAASDSPGDFLVLLVFFGVFWCLNKKMC